MTDDILTPKERELYNEVMAENKRLRYYLEESTKEIEDLRAAIQNLSCKTRQTTDEG